MRIRFSRAALRLGVSAAAFLAMAVVNTRTATAATSSHSEVVHTALAVQISTCAAIGCSGGTIFCADYIAGGTVYNCYGAPEPK